ncbi:MAG: hypothetical protein H6722_08895 [Sandaracinus sp.]|nr:hypothetical protein [Sandaracinus sp.]MCB9623438.1 hypothetical protein [Sandaracinus sp.]
MLVRWLGAFALTQLVELPLYAHALREAVPSRARWAWAGLPSALTHPLLWWVFPSVAGRLGYVGAVMSLELVVVVVEAVALRTIVAGARSTTTTASHLGTEPTSFLAGSRYGPWVVAAVANGASVAAGALSRALFAWP